MALAEEEDVGTGGQLSPK